jgi:Zn-dependent peptidase ImmA (M78 family)
MTIEFPSKLQEEYEAKRKEEDANLFAYCLLMPRKFVIEQFSKHYPNGKIGSLSGIDQMALMFLVTPAMMFKRLQMLELIEYM